MPTVYILLFPLLIVSVWITVSGDVITATEGSFFGQNCTWRHNITDVDLIHAEQQEALENCVYYYLVQKDMLTSGDTYMLFLKPPLGESITINIQQLTIIQVDLVDKTSNQFHLRGEMYIAWNDARLKWNQTEWKIDNFLVHNNHHIWTPMFTDESSCSPLDGCLSTVNDVQVYNDGKVEARVVFRYPSFCGMNFYNYPEETNDCFLFLSVMETEAKIQFTLDTKVKEKINKAVAITDVENQPSQTIFKNVATSAWKVEDRTLDVVKVGGLRSQYLKISIHAKKDMATLKVALRIPATIATLLMLASPLFGDLRTQVFVKFGTLILQTICFLFLCSIAPENGFVGNKPRLYSFYEFLFLNSTISICITLICLALCRVKRTVPPSHNLYLMAKLINRFVCCTEPDPATSYTRYLEDTRENGGTMEAQRSDNAPDHTIEWRHLYIAANNLLAGISFSIFCMVVIFDIL